MVVQLQETKLPNGQQQFTKVGDIFKPLHSHRFNICKCDTTGYFYIELKTTNRSISHRVCYDKKQTFFTGSRAIFTHVCLDKSCCFSGDIVTSPSMIKVTKTGILRHTMVFFVYA